VGRQLCDQALAGLECLRATYLGEPDKLKAINKVVERVRQAEQNSLNNRKCLTEEVKEALNRQADLNDSLKDFCKKVFANKQIMAGSGQGAVTSENAADMIYGIYNGTSQAADVRTKKMVRWNHQLYHVCHNRCMPGSPFLQGTAGLVSNRDLPLSYLVENTPPLVNDVLYKKLCRYFIYSHTRTPISGADFRVYGNVLPEYVHLLAGVLLEQVLDCGITSFKFAGRASIEARCDSTVIYCGTRNHALRLAEILATRYASWFGIQVPHMTKRLKPKVGVSVGAEPGNNLAAANPAAFRERYPRMDERDAEFRAWLERLKPLATGYHSLSKAHAMDHDLANKGKDGPGWKKQMMEERQMSFGTFRSQLLALAIDSYNANKQVYAEVPAFEFFKRCVAAAFRGWGLDPADPLA